MDIEKVNFYVKNYEKLCRLCLSNEKLVNIYSTVEKRDRIFVIKNFIKDGCSCLGIEIKKDDGFPNYICEKCEKNLNIIWNFKKKCRQNRDLLLKIKDKSIYEELDKAEIVASTEIPKIEPLVKIELTSDSIISRLPNDINVSRTTSSNQEDEKTKVVDPIKLEDLDNDEDDDILDISGNFDDEELVDYCDDAYDSDWKQPSVSEDSANEDKSCEAADDTVRTKKTKKSTGMRKSPKKEGAQVVDKWPDEKSPEREKGKKKKTICPVCGALITNMTSHLRVHEDVRPYKCEGYEGCEKAFISNTKLKSHINSVHLKQRSFRCEICGKAFLEKNNLKNHLRVHIGDRKYKCDICGKTFLFNGSLTCHKMTHYGEKKHQCKECGKMFLFRTCLKKHALTHTNVKPHSCSFCDKTFRTNTQRKMHENSHTGAKPLSCKLCQEAFANHKARSVHMKSKHMEQLLEMNLIDDRGYLKQ